MSNNTDEELFDLCKRVYEKTGWQPVSFTIPKEGEDIWSGDPLYTIDCLLEKFPLQMFVQPDFAQNFILQKVHEGAEDEWKAGYPYIIEGESDTPLKALLKLTLKLIEDGVEL